MKPVTKDTIKGAKNELVAAAILVLFGAFGRYALVGWHIQPFPNFEVIMVTAFLAAMLLRSYIGVAVAFLAIALSDLMLGNISSIGTGSIVLFTYSGFAAIALISMASKKALTPHLSRLNAGAFGLGALTGVAFVLVYDVWTNFGWWALMYPHTTEGIAAVYALGAPFMLYHAISGAITFAAIGVPAAALYGAFSKSQSPARTGAAASKDAPAAN